MNDCYPRDGPDYDSSWVSLEPLEFQITKCLQHCEERCGYNNKYVFIDGKNTMTSTVVTDMKMMCVQADVNTYKGEWGPDLKTNPAQIG